MRVPFVAAFALIAASSLPAQQAVPDLSAATPVAGNWTYAATMDGSEATFANPSALAQLTIRCVRATRRIMISKPSTTAAPFMYVWTNSAVRSVPASFNPLTNRITIDVISNDPLLDALAFSRGRIGVIVPQPAGSAAQSVRLVVPAWPEIARVVEDCRS
ncbi:MAG TPA: hypothetical protein VF067_03875 [Sphingomicrobium sp.]